MDNNIKMMDKLKRRWTTTGAPSANIPELSTGGQIIPLVLTFCICAAENMLALMVKRTENMFLDNCQDQGERACENGRSIKLLVLFESNIELTLIFFGPLFNGG